LTETAHSAQEERPQPPPRKPHPWILGQESTLRAVLIVFFAILAAELVTISLEGAHHPDLNYRVFIEDIGAHFLLSMPLIYFFFVRPLSRSNRDKAAAEDALRDLVEHLDQTVQERTRELEVANRSVVEEAKERSKADARNHLRTRMLEVVPQAVIATGKGGAIVYWNRTAEWLFGWTEQEVLGETLALVTSFPVSAFKNGLSGIGGASGWKGEIQAQRRGGAMFPAFLTSSPMRRQDETLAGFVYTFIDISDQKEAEAALRLSEEKYVTLVESSPTGIFIAREGRIQFANQQLCEMVGRYRDELKGTQVTDIIHPDDWPMVRDLWRDRLAGTGPNQDTECRILTAKGEVRWVSGRTTVIRVQGETALLGNIQDITARHLAEEGLKESQRVLHHLSLRLMTAQEGERKRIAQELHDSIGQSLSAIKFMVERALEVTCPLGRADHIQPLQAVIPVIQASVEEVRRISMALRPSTLDDLGLLATLAWFSREFTSTYPHLEVERQIEVREAEVPDALRISIFRIVQEAMNNAAKHAQAKKIILSLRSVFGLIQLVVADDGVGFDPAIKRQADASGGFGLASMRERTELTGGNLIVHSEPGQGTVVTAQWPPQVAG